METPARRSHGIPRRGALVAHVVAGRGSLAKLASVRAALTAGGLVEQRLIALQRADDPLPRDIRIGGRLLPRPDVVLDGAGTRGQRGGRILVELERTLTHLAPGLVVVAGDGDATLAGALAASKLGIALCHVEAGLRSFENGRPEEQNRRLVDRLSTVLLADSEDAQANLVREETGNQRISAVGSTLVDAVLANVASARALAAWRAHKLRAGDYVLVAVRSARLGTAGTLPAFERLARIIPVLVALRPPASAPLHAGRRVRAVCEPSYRGFLSLASGAAAIVTDSGAVQVEATALRIPCFTVADATERTETVLNGTNLLLGADPRRLRELEPLLGPRPLPGSLPPLWDGHAGVRAARTIERSLGLGLAVVA